MWDGASWGPRFSRQFNDWELEEVKAFFGRLHDLWVLIMLWFGQTQKNDDFSVKYFYSSLASRRAEPFPYSIVWNS